MRLVSELHEMPFHVLREVSMINNNLKRKFVINNLSISTIFFFQ